MRWMSNSQGGFCLAAFVLGLVTLGPAAIADDERTPSSKFSLKLSGGLRWTSVGDIGDHAVALDNYLYGLCSGINYLPGQLEKPGPWGPDIGLELRLHFRHGFSAGIEVGFSGVSESSRSYGIAPFEIGSAWEYRSITTSMDTKVWTMPVRLDVAHSWAFSRALSLSVGCGLAGYFVWLRLDRYMSFHPLSYLKTALVYWPALNDEYRVRGFGVEPVGRISLELRISNPLSFVFEVEGRYAKVNRLAGRQSYIYYSPVNSTYFVDGEIEGTLLMGTSDKTVMGLPEGFPDLSVIPSEAMRTVRFDLSGFSCRLGLRIRL
jgi:hypothetical protein